MNKAWFYYGGGFSGFGKNEKPIIMENKKPKANEVLVRVDAVAICASDIKMINLGAEYPLFKNRDLKEDPVILGHELSLTIIEVGSALESKWKAGMRVGIQPDVYMKGIRYCIGVNVEGGFQQYMILNESVFHSDHGVTIFPVDENLSYASVAQLEPHACVEAAFRLWGRSSFSGDRELLIYIDENVKTRYHLDMHINSSQIKVIGDVKKLEGLTNYQALNSFEEITKIEDFLIIGEVKADILDEQFKKLSKDSLVCWLSSNDVNVMVSMDVAKIHYSKMNFIGAKSTRLSEAFKKPKRYEYLDGGKLLIMGGAGAMGRIHTLRAIMAKDGPETIVVTARRRERLEMLQTDFKQFAQERKKELRIVAMEDIDWQKQISNIIGKEGFDDVIVSAPGIDPVNAAVPLLKKDGLLILFSGTSYGNYADIPIGNVVNGKFQVIASSGSTTDDEKKVMQKIMNKTINPDDNIAGIVGLNELKNALIAVNNGDFPGKLIVYPQLEELPLMSLKEIKDDEQKLATYIEKYGWSREAEQILYEYYKRRATHE